MHASALRVVARYNLQVKCSIKLNKGNNLNYTLFEHYNINVRCRWRFPQFKLCSAHVHHSLCATTVVKLLVFSLFIIKFGTNN